MSARTSEGLSDKRAYYVGIDNGMVPSNLDATCYIRTVQGDYESAILDDDDGDDCGYRSFGAGWANTRNQGISLNSLLCSRNFSVRFVYCFVYAMHDNVDLAVWETIILMDFHFVNFIPTT